jgi:hypothetical protein
MPQPPIDLAKSPDWVFPLLMFCLGVFFATAVVRRGVEVYIPSFAQRNQWKKVWLPSLPVIIGASAAAVMHAYPFLNSLPTWGTRAFYGCVAGGLSSFMYKVFQAFFNNNFKSLFDQTVNGSGNQGDTIFAVKIFLWYTNLHMRSYFFGKRE